VFFCYTPREMSDSQDLSNTTARIVTVVAAATFIVTVVLTARFWRRARFQPILDNYGDLDDLTEAIHKAGLGRSQLMIGVDLSVSNATSGAKTFWGRSLHTLALTDVPDPNPYQLVLWSIVKTLADFDADGRIPAYGMRGAELLPFVPGAYCEDLERVLSAYGDLVRGTTLAGPSNFAPLIRRAIATVRETGSYHILLIVACHCMEGRAEQETRDAIVEATRHPLSIVMVGVGDGPWDLMREFDDGLPERAFDNFQCARLAPPRTARPSLAYGSVGRRRAVVEFHKHWATKFPTIEFARHALMEIPEQFATITRLGLHEPRPATKREGSMPMRDLL
jgi:E3 ubiquitin-protein ligase RGLG